MDLSEMGAMMKELGAVSPSFRPVYEFFHEINGVDEKRLILIARHKLPTIAKIRSIQDLAGDNALALSLSRAPVLSDADVLALVRSFLEGMTQAMAEMST